MQQYLNDASQFYRNYNGFKIFKPLGDETPGALIRQASSGMGGWFTGPGHPMGEGIPASFWYSMNNIYIKLLNNSERKGSAYVEFYVGDRTEKMPSQDNNSLYLDDLIYNYAFANMFKKSNKNFNYFGETKYGQSELIDLLAFLKENSNLLEHTRSIKEFYGLVDNYSGPPPNTPFITALKQMGITEDWHQIVIALKEVNQGLIDIVQRCLNNNKVLWVLGV